MLLLVALIAVGMTEFAPIWRYNTGSSSSSTTIKDVSFAADGFCFQDELSDSTDKAYTKFEKNGTYNIKVTRCDDDSTDCTTGCVEDYYDFGGNGEYESYMKTNGWLYFSLESPAGFITEVAGQSLTLDTAGYITSVYHCKDAATGEFSAGAAVCNKTDISYGLSKPLDDGGTTTDGIGVCQCLFGAGFQFECSTDAATLNHVNQFSFGCGDTCTGCCPFDTQSLLDTTSAYTECDVDFFSDAGCKKYYFCGFDFPMTVAGTGFITFSLALLALMTLLF